MAVDISAELLAIMQAIYGRDVRGSIHDALDKMCDEINDAIEHQLISVDTTLTISGEGADAAAVGAMFDQSLVMRPNLADGTDLNTLQGDKPGIYRLLKNRTYINIPAGISGDTGWLINFDQGNTGFTTLQILIYCNSDNVTISGVYIRSYYLTGLTWGSWIKILRESDLETDKSLTVLNKPADAKTVGDKIIEIDNALVQNSGVITFQNIQSGFHHYYTKVLKGQKVRLTKTTLTPVPDMANVMFRKENDSTNYQQTNLLASDTIEIIANDNYNDIVIWVHQAVSSLVYNYSIVSAFEAINNLSETVEDLEDNINECEEAVQDINNLINIQEKTTQYNTGSPTSSTVGKNRRWFLNDIANGKITSVAVRCRVLHESPRITIEIWELHGDKLNRIANQDVVPTTQYGFNAFDIEAESIFPMMISIIAYEDDTVNYILDSSAGFSTRRTSDITSTTLSLDDIEPFQNMGLLAYATYQISAIGEKIITVNKNGSGIYDNIAEAVTNATDGDTILVYPGIYTEPIEAWGKTLSIIGVDKRTCIIKNDTGNYSTPAVEIDSGRIAGFTIISTGENPTCDSSDVNNYMRDYSIHVDHVHSEGQTLIIEDCIIKNNHRTALGMGCYKNSTVIVRNCDLWSGAPPEDIQNPLWNKRGVLYFHNRQPSAFFNNETGQKMRFINNTMYCEDIIAVYIGDTCDGIDMEGNHWINEMEVEFINNMICAKYANGTYKTSSNGVSTPTEFLNDSVISGTGFTNHLKLSPISYGNNIAYLNSNS